MRPPNLSSEKTPATREALAASLLRAVRLFIAGSSLFGQRVAEKLALHPTDMQFLNLLDLLGPMTPGALAQCSGLSSGGVTVVLDRLEKAGYVRRSAHPEDRRSVLVSIVASRQKRVNANYESAQSQFHWVLKTFSDQELQTVLRFFLAAGNAGPQIQQRR
ncbi:MAG TPA: MarR family transcriptional regulator [Acidobacteriaceae bacterium]|nr:MarR family transcriptional regulator [Acidobacteriaceae bacterium]